MKIVKRFSIIIILIAIIFMFEINSYASTTLQNEEEIFELTEEKLKSAKKIETSEKVELKAQETLQEEGQGNNTGIALFSSRTLTGEVELGDIYSNYEPIFIENDKENVYYLTYFSGSNSTGTYAYFKIVKQNIVTKEKEDIIGKGKSSDGTTYQEDAYYPLAHYELGNIIYVECVNYNCNVSDYNKVKIFGIDITTKQLVYEQEFALTVNTADKYPSFAVDKEQRFYLVNDFTEIIVFDKNGSVYYRSKLTIGEPYEIIINSVSPTGKVLFYSVNQYRKSGLRSVAYQGIQKLENGKFVNKDYYTVSTANGKDPVWHFIDDQDKYAVNQYGEIAQFDYEAEGQTGISLLIITTTSKYQKDGYYGYPKRYPLYIINGNYIYIMGSQNELYVFDKSQYNFVGRIQNILDSDEEATQVEYITNVDGQVKLYYSEDSVLYVKTINLEDKEITAKQNILYSTHISQTHTKEEIEEKYKASNLFDYSQILYDIQPSTTVPYQEGTLKQGVIDDTLNRLNFYRWIYGVNKVTLNTSKMARNQKGALIQSINDVLTHQPEQPEGMTDEFYSEAYDGCNMKYENPEDTYSGNCDYNEAGPNEHIDDYVSDLYNVNLPGNTDAVGHRWSMLDPDAYATSFGYCNSYSTVSMYYNPNNTTNLEQNFYAYPTAGYFPNKLFNTSERWSIYFKDNVRFAEGYKLEFIYNGKSYEATELGLEATVPAITFKMPDELANLVGGRGKTMPVCTITVKLSGVTNENLDDVTYQYDVNFFTMEADLLKGDVNKDGKINLYDALQILKQAILGGALTDEQLYIMDYNGDGKVDLYDAFKFLQQAILG